MLAMHYIHDAIERQETERELEGLDFESQCELLAQDYINLSKCTHNRDLSN